jgi:hypothetical protein
MNTAYNVGMGRKWTPIFFNQMMGVLFLFF